MTVLKCLDDNASINILYFKPTQNLKYKPACSYTIFPGQLPSISMRGSYEILDVDPNRRTVTIRLAEGVKYEQNGPKEQRGLIKLYPAN